MMPGSRDRHTSYVKFQRPCHLGLINFHTKKRNMNTRKKSSINFDFNPTRIFGALTGLKILAGTAPIKVGSARLVLVDLVACFELVSATVTQ